jgi:hypothetical protein
MKALYIGLALVSLGLSACGQSAMDQMFAGSEARNSSMDDTECRHQGPQGTGFVVNCTRHNNDMREFLHR